MSSAQLIRQDYYFLHLCEPLNSGLDTPPVSQILRLLALSLPNHLSSTLAAVLQDALSANGIEQISAAIFVRLFSI